MTIVSEKIETHDLDIDAIVEAVKDSDIVTGFDGDRKRSLYLGSVLSLTPSGKYYQPYACSNLDPCPVCNGAGTIPNPHHLPKLFSKASERVEKIIQSQIKNNTFHKWPIEVQKEADRLRSLEARTKPELTCPRCDGFGSAEACDDAAWMESLEDDLREHGLWLESGEGDFCDMFVCGAVEDEDEDED